VEITWSVTKRKDIQEEFLSFAHSKWILNDHRGKNPIPIRLQDPNIISGSKRPAKNKKMGTDKNPEEKKIKIHDVKDDLPKETEVYLSKETEVDVSKEKEVDNFSMNLVPSSQVCRYHFTFYAGIT
jgi:hypothetical protein